MEDTTEFYIGLGVVGGLGVVLFYWFFIHKDFTLKQTSFVLGTRWFVMLLMGLTLIFAAAYAFSHGLDSMYKASQESQCKAALKAAPGCSPITEERLSAIRNTMITAMSIGIVLSLYAIYRIRQDYGMVFDSMSEILESTKSANIVASSNVNLV